MRRSCAAGQALSNREDRARAGRRRGSAVDPRRVLDRARGRAASPPPPAAASCSWASTRPIGGHRSLARRAAARLRAPSRRGPDGHPRRDPAPAVAHHLDDHRHGPPPRRAWRPRLHGGPARGRAGAGRLGPAEDAGAVDAVLVARPHGGGGGLVGHLAGRGRPGHDRHGPGGPSSFERGGARQGLVSAASPPRGAHAAAGPAGTGRDRGSPALRRGLRSRAPRRPG